MHKPARKQGRYIRVERIALAYARACALSHEGIGGGFAGLDGAFHKALPVGEVLAGEEDLAVRALEYRADAEPLAGFVERVGAVGDRISLPGVGYDAFRFFRRVFVESRNIVGDDSHTAFVGLR